MSWSDWCDHIKANGFVAGGIYGKDGSVWAEFCDEDDCRLPAEEIPKILKCIDNGNPMAEAVNVKGGKQTGIAADSTEGFFYGKKKTDSCLVAVKCNQSIIVGVGGKQSEPRQLLQPLSKVGESLKGNGY